MKKHAINVLFFLVTAVIALDMLLFLVMLMVWFLETLGLIPHSLR
jgi:hypothetical protein